MLDYQINRKSPKVGALLEETKFDGLKLFQCGVTKLLKLKKYLRKKQFKFNDLIAFLRRENAEKTNHNNEEQLKLIQSLTPVIKSRCARLVSQRVEKIIQTIERQNFKIEKIVHVLAAVHEAITMKIKKDKKPKLETINLFRIKTEMIVIDQGKNCDNNPSIEGVDSNPLQLGSARQALKNKRMQREVT